MDERMVKVFKKEEEFLDEFGDVASVAAKFLDHEWTPSETADDARRATLEYFYSTNEVKDLNFDSAEVFHLGNQFSSVQIILKSSSRLVNVKVKLVGDKLIAEKVVDKPLQ